MTAARKALDYFATLGLVLLAVFAFSVAVWCGVQVLVGLAQMETRTTEILAGKEDPWLKGPPNR